MEICTANPGFDVDLHTETTVVALTSIISSGSTKARENEAERTSVVGDALLVRTIDRWFCTGSYTVGGRKLLNP